jgi:hypothetical protein
MIAPPFGHGAHRSGGDHRRRVRVRGDRPQSVERPLLARGVRRDGDRGRVEAAQEVGDVVEARRVQEGHPPAAQAEGLEHHPGLTIPEYEQRVAFQDQWSLAV